MAFGVYRPLNGESRQKIQAALTCAKDKVDKHFAELGALNRYTKLRIPEDHGVTYVRRDNVLRALSTSAMHNFSLTRIQANVSNYNYRRADTPTLPLDELDWFGVGGMKLVGKFAVKAAEEQGLVNDSENIGAFLEEAGVQQLDVYQPDHVTLCRFRRSRNGHGLDEGQKDYVKTIVREELVAAEIGAITLEGLVVADEGYRQPPLEPVPASA